VLSRQDVDGLDQLQRDIQELRSSGKYDAALQPAREVIERRGRLQGTAHWETATARWGLQSLKQLAALPAEAQVELAAAERLERDEAPRLLRERRFAEGVALLSCIRALRRRHLGDDHPDVGNASYGLGMFFQRAGRNDLAAVLLQEVLNLHRRMLGEDHPDTGRLYGDMANILLLRGRSAEAEGFARRGLAVYHRVLGEADTPAAAYESLAGCLIGLGRHSEATVLQRQAVLRRRRDNGDEHPDTATACGTLAELLSRQGDQAEAEDLGRTAVRILRGRLGERHPRTAQARMALAQVLQAQGKFVEAEPLYRSAVAVYRTAAGGEHPATLYALVLLATVLDGQGKFDEAESLYHQLLAVCPRVLGERHPTTAQAHAKWGLHLQARGRYREAETQARQALATASAMLGEQTPQTMGCHINLATALAGQGRQAEAEASWRAAVASYDGARRRMGPGGLQRGAGFVQRSPRGSLAACLIQAGKAAEAWEVWEADLARGLLEELAARRPGADAGDAARVLSLAEVQERVPDDTALVGWLWVRTTLSPAGPREFLWGCVLRRRGAPVWVPLPGTGPDGTWTGEENELRRRLGQALALAQPGWEKLAQRQCALCAAPLEKYLGSTEDLPPVRRLVALGLDHLGGPVELLADHFVVSYAPSATLFARQAARRRALTSAGPLLALGDPTYQPPGDTPPPAAAAERGATTFPPLGGSRREVEAVARLFDRADLLLGPDASKQRLVRLAADGRLGEYRVLHLATHAVLDSSRPLGSALVLAQDGLPSPLEQVLDGREPLAGRLTAEEIARTWKLDADLVTLSACYSALGKYQHGEGYLGFTQALFLAGARSCVLSLWKADDQATALLMTRFYENLLGKRAGLGGPMPRAEALREAKAWLRQLTGVEAARLAQARGEREREPAPSTASAPFAHPYYWAGFVLVGSPD
jgi:CHAT domain-containing protein/tetratricopeptide (TPR) repeat protein